ncbi:MAG TPA: ABC transporter substrate-binding protein [Streptosporangiaceae bacterium]|jgi:peptide/nickel transport system substrate-binding protein|nr:ABC transporter substrate-binding protein [Streptosporangiaceae bacterium]
MTSNPRRSLVLATALLAAVGLASCAKSTTSSTTASSAPVYGGTLRIIANAGPDHFDTVPAYYTGDYIMERAYARQLLSYSTLPAQTTSSALWTQETTPQPDIATAVPTTANGGVTNGGLTYTYHIRSGVDWNTSPARQVVADDFIREFKAFCNPVAPVGNQLYFRSTIAGFSTYCDAETAYFGAKNAPSPTAANIAAYQNAHSISGMTAPNPMTLQVKLAQPASDFNFIMAMPFTSARPMEYDGYVPDSAQFRQHTISDGPYQITAYVPGKSITLQRNPAWKQSADPIRHQYVKTIQMTMGTSSPQTALSEMQANTGDMVDDLVPPVPPTSIPGLTASHDARLHIWPGSSTNPYIVFNMRSPDGNGAMGKLLVRQAIEYGVNKAALLKVLGGPSFNQIINTAAPPGSLGWQNYNLYPTTNSQGDGAKCKAMLKSAGYPSGVTLIDTYIADTVNTDIFQSIQGSLSSCGITLKGKPEPPSSYFVSLGNAPQNNKANQWDMGQPGWFPDWFGNNGRTTLQPLFGTNCVVNTNNYGCFSSTAVDGLMKQALSATSVTAAGSDWHQADMTVMKNAVIVPLDSALNPNYTSTRVKNAGANSVIFSPTIGGTDVTNVWLNPNTP